MLDRPSIHRISRETDRQALSTRVSRDRIELWAALWIVYVVWGSTYLAIKLAVRTLPPLLTAGTRFLAAAAVLAAILAVARRSLRVDAPRGARRGGARRRAARARRRAGARRRDADRLRRRRDDRRLGPAADRRLAHARRRARRARDGARRRGRPRRARARRRPGRARRRLGRGRPPRHARRVALVVARLVRLAPALACRRTRSSRPSTRCSAAGSCSSARRSSPGRRASSTRAALQPGPLAAWAYLAVVGSVVGFSAYAWLLGNAPISQVVTHQYVNPLVAVALGAAGPRRAARGRHARRRGADRRRGRGHGPARGARRPRWR